MAATPLRYIPIHNTSIQYPCFCSTNTLDEHTMYEWYELYIAFCLGYKFYASNRSSGSVSKVSPTFVGCDEAAEAAAKDPPVSAEAHVVATSTAAFDFTQLFESIATETWSVQMWVGKNAGLPVLFKGCIDTPVKRSVCIQKSLSKTLATFWGRNLQVVVWVVSFEFRWW